MENLCIWYTPNCQATFANYSRILNSCRNKYKIVRNFEEADWCIFPFCSGTDSQITKGEEELRDLFARKKEGCKVIVTGCIFYTNESKRDFLKNYDIDYMVYPKNQVEEICKILGVNPSKSIYNHYEILGNVLISEGCLNKCSFCRVHYSDRPLTSVPMEILENQVRDLISNGTKLLYIQGFNSAQYGIDLYGKKSLHILIKRISKIDGIEGIIIVRLSLSDIYDELINEIRDNDLVLSVETDIQSGSDKLLKLMNVKHTVNDIRKCFSLIGQKIFYTRIISGFPHETKEDVEQTINLLNELGLSYVLISPYNDSKDIPSGKMKQLSKQEASEHYEMYKQADESLRKTFDKKNDGKSFIGYISSFSLLDGIAVYCPKLGGSVRINIEENDSYTPNLNDKVRLLLSNGEISLDGVVEKSTIQTEEPTYSDNSMVDFLSFIRAIHSDYAFSSTMLNELYTKLFDFCGGGELGIDEFKENISPLPNFVQKTLLNSYQIVNNSKS